MDAHTAELFFSPIFSFNYSPEWTAKEKDMCLQSNYFLAGNAKGEDQRDESNALTNKDGKKKGLK